MIVCYYMGSFSEVNLSVCISCCTLGVQMCNFSYNKSWLPDALRRAARKNRRHHHWHRWGNIKSDEEN